jgi:hypothetical protein
MPMFYFNVISASGSILDFEGTELPDIEAARVEAIEDARALMSTAVLEGREFPRVASTSATRRAKSCSPLDSPTPSAGLTSRALSFDRRADQPLIFLLRNAI